MADDNRTQWVNSYEVGNSPEDGKGGSAGDHEASAEGAEDKCAFKALYQFGHLLKEGGIFNLLGSCTPGHIYFEEMAKKCL